MEPLTLNFIRCLGATFFLWALIPFHPGFAEALRLPAATLLFLVLSALLGVSVGDTLYIRGLRRIRVTLAFPIAQSATPLLTVGAAFLFLSEEFTRSFLIGTFLVLVGMYLMAVPEGPAVRFPGAGRENRRRGIGLILTASLFWTASIALLKMGLKEAEPLLANGIRLPVSALALLPLAVREKSDPPGPQKIAPRLCLLGAFSGILGFGIGGVLFLTAIQQAGAGKAMVLTGCAPLFGLPISLFFLKERVTPRIVAGTILMVAGVGCIF